MKRGYLPVAPYLKFMVRPARLERATFCFVDKRSIQLSYERKGFKGKRTIKFGVLSVKSRY